MSKQPGIRFTRPLLHCSLNRLARYDHANTLFGTEPHAPLVSRPLVQVRLWQLEPQDTSNEVARMPLDHVNE